MALAAFSLSFVSSCLVICTLLLTPLAAQRDTSAIHKYADAAACQMGGREGNYLPTNITPGGTNIPMNWDTLPLLWQQTNINTGAGQYVVVGDGKVHGMRKAVCKIGEQCPIEADFPEIGAGGPFNDPYASDLYPKCTAGIFKGAKCPNSASCLFACVAGKCTGGANNGGACATEMDCPGQFECVGNDKAAHLKCDHFSYVDPTCTPDQFVMETFRGACQVSSNTVANNAGATCTKDTDCMGKDAKCATVRWHVLFRRYGGAAMKSPKLGDPQPNDWGPKYIDYYDVVDAVGLKSFKSAAGTEIGSYGTVWLDGLNGSAATSFNNGFRAGSMPRPGGVRPSRRPEGVRASNWFDTPAEMVSGACVGCHGTPFNGDDWIRGANRTSSQVSDDKKVFWHAGNGGGIIAFPDHTSFTTADDTVTKTSYDCTGCHARWMQKSGSTPGSDAPLARYLTMVHDASAGNPFPALPSFDVNDANAYRELASGWRSDNTPVKFLDKRANQTHWMTPKRIVKKDGTNFTVDNWKSMFDEEYNGVACCGSGFEGTGMVPPFVDGTAVSCKNIKCEGLTSQASVKAVFQTPWMLDNAIRPIAASPANVVQPIAPPDSPDTPTLQAVDKTLCPVAIPEGSLCFQLSWGDPKKDRYGNPGLSSAFNAPPDFYYWLQTKKISETFDDLDKHKYCVNDTADFTKMQVDGTILSFTQKPDTSNPNYDWQYTYKAYGLLGKCQKMIVRLCGGWCSQQIKYVDPVTKKVVTKNVPSTDEGLGTSVLENNNCD